MAEKFGNTWWGQAWLKALSNIDYENRIPRGASYARKGAVSSLKIKDNIVEAKVQGSRRIPYKVMVVLPKFQPEEIDRFVDRLLLNPSLISGLLMRRLSPEVARIADDCGLRLFPTRWNDLKMNCNCPDWAVPCKHLAAVIYMLSREIDNNPFLVFDLHGLHLLDELKSRGVNLDERLSNALPIPVKQLLVKGKASGKGAAAGKGEERPTSAVRVDFSGLESLADAGARLLPEAPPFYTKGDFKAYYLEQMERVTKHVGRFLAGKLKEGALFGCFSFEPEAVTTDTKVALFVDESLGWTATLTDFDGTRPVELGRLLTDTLVLNRDFLPDYDPSVAALHTAIHAAIHLLANSQAKPEIVRLPDGAYRVVWQPLPTSAKAMAVVEALGKMMPTGMVSTSTGQGKRSCPLDNQALLLTTELLTRLVNSLSPKHDDGEVARLFFQGDRCRFDAIGQAQMPGAVRVWCDSLVISEDQWWPVIYVADKSREEGSFTLAISVQSSNPDKVGDVPLEQVLCSDRWERDRFNVLQSVMRLSNVIPRLDRYVDGGATVPVTFDDTEFATFLTSVIPAMRMLGLKVYLPKSLQKLLRPMATLNITDKERDEGMFSVFDFFTYDWRVAVGDEVIDMETFQRMLSNAEGLIRFKKSYIYVSKEDMEKLLARMQSKVELAPAELYQAALSGEFQSAPVKLSEGVKKRLDAIRTLDSVAIPADLRATLRPYQERGFSWLYRNMKVGFGSILADDMGLGKTLQAIALMLKVKEEHGQEEGRALVVAPVGLLYNWEAEIQRFAPTLRTHIYHGGARDLKGVAEADVVLTSYGIVRSDAAKIRKLPWQMIVIDEAQNIKNPKAAQSKAVCSLQAGCRIALSGTPVENRLSEYWSIMNFANSGYLGTLSDFTGKFVKRIQVFNDVHCAEQLKKITSPFLMRRMKTDKAVISDLPDKVERDVYATLTPEQAALYEQTLKEAMAVIENIGTGTPQELFKRQGIILQMILALKQICNHPALFLKNRDTDAALSGKAQLLLDRVQPILEANDKVIVFTQYREMGHMLQDIIAENLGVRPLFYHGGCSVKERTQMVDKFQNSRSSQVFLLSLKAAGTGLNLTAANNVIHYDLWWNPAVEAQATDRAYRIGQKRNVMVDRFITKGTFEERINELINSKRHLAEMTVATGETWIGNLSNKELHDLFTPQG